MLNGTHLMIVKITHNDHKKVGDTEQQSLRGVLMTIADVVPSISSFPAQTKEILFDRK